MRAVLGATVVSLLALAVVSCAGQGEGLDAQGRPPGKAARGSGSVQATFSSLRSEVFVPICAQSGCHTGAGQAGLAWDAADAYYQVVGVPSREAPSVLRVRANVPDDSYVVRKVEGAAGIVGVRMPADGPPYLSRGQIDAIRAWIANGALNN